MEEQRTHTGLLHLMKLMDLPNATYHLDALLLGTNEQRCRLNCVKWINDLTHAHSLLSDTRDQAVQILDAFLIKTNKARVGPKIDRRFVAYAAVTAITFSFKLHETASSLRLSSFKGFDVADLKEMESHVLNQLAFNLIPQITPCGFVRELLSIWEPVQAAAGEHGARGLSVLDVDKLKVAKVSDDLIAEFWLETSSMQYAPSTIAISALILAFSILHLDCSDWLASVPNYCLSMPVAISSSSAGTLQQDANVRQLLDVDSCLVSFARIPSLLHDSPKKASGGCATTPAAAPIPLRQPMPQHPPISNSPTSKVALPSPVAPSHGGSNGRPIRSLDPLTTTVDAVSTAANGVTTRVFKIKRCNLHSDMTVTRPKRMGGQDGDGEDMPASVRRRIVL